MAQLTGLQTGTPQNDNFIGDIDLDLVTESRTEAGISNAIINSLKGDDFVTGTATISPASDDLTLLAAGISQSVIDTGIGDDTVLGSGTGLGFFIGASRGPGFIGAATGTGLLRSSVYAGNGNDSLTFEGAGQGVPQTGIAVSGSVVDGGKGADVITATASLIDKGNSGSATGLLNSVVAGGGQQDTIDIKADSTLNSGLAKGVDQSIVSGDGGDDTITIEATGEVAVAVSNADIYGRGDSDTIVLTSTADAVATGPRDVFTFAKSTGAEAGSLISGNGGDDLISVNATVEGGDSIVYGVDSSRVEGGNGRDKISLNAKNASFSFADEAFAALNASIKGGNDNDVIELITTLDTFDVIGRDGVNVAAASQSIIKGGAGDDDILLSVGGSVKGAKRGITGANESEIYGNSGDDRLTVVADFADYDIIDTLIFGGAGDDTFDVGIGDGMLRGGVGVDVAVLDYLNAETMAVTSIPNGIRVIGTQTKSGEEGAWTQDLLGIESYLVNDLTYTNDTLVQTFSR